MTKKKATTRRRTKATDAKAALAELAASGDASDGLKEMVSRPDPGDPPSEAAIDIDFAFVQHDPTDIQPYLDKYGLTFPDDMEPRWCERDHRVMTKRTAQGWVPFEGGRVTRGTLVLCARPKRIGETLRAMKQQRVEEALNAPMERFEQEASRHTGSKFQTFDGPRSARDGL